MLWTCIGIGSVEIVMRISIGSARVVQWSVSVLGALK